MIKSFWCVDESAPCAVANRNGSNAENTGGPGFFDFEKVTTKLTKMTIFDKPDWRWYGESAVRAAR